MAWFGTSTDFSLLITKRRHSNRYTTHSAWSRTVSLDYARIKKSSLYATRCISISRRRAKIGFRVLVNTHRADDSPKGRHVKWYIFPRAWNLSHFLWVQCMGWQSKCPSNPLWQPVPQLQQVFHHVNTLHFEMLDVYELVEGYEVYVPLIPALHPSWGIGKSWTRILPPQDVPTVELPASWAVLLTPCKSDWLVVWRVGRRLLVWLWHKVYLVTLYCVQYPTVLSDYRPIGQEMTEPLTWGRSVKYRLFTPMHDIWWVRELL